MSYRTMTLIIRFLGGSTSTCPPLPSTSFDALWRWQMGRKRGISKCLSSFLLSGAWVVWAQLLSCTFLNRLDCRLAATSSAHSFRLADKIYVDCPYPKQLHKRFQMATEPVSCVEKKPNEGLLTTFTVFYSPERESIIQVNSGDVGPVQRAVAAGRLSSSSWRLRPAAAICQESTTADRVMVIQ